MNRDGVMGVSDSLQRVGAADEKIVRRRNEDARMRWRNEDNEKWKVESWRGSWKLGTDSLWGGNCGSQAQAAWRIQGIVEGADGV